MGASSGPQKRRPIRGSKGIPVFLLLPPPGAISDRAFGRGFAAGRLLAKNVVAG
jgi:hypothetical protein